VGEGSGAGSSKAAPAAPVKKVTMTAKEVPKQSFLSLLKSSTGVGAGAPSGSSGAAGGGGGGAGGGGGGASDDDDGDEGEGQGQGASAGAGARVGSGASAGAKKHPRDAAGAASGGARKKRWAVLEDDFEMRAKSKDWRDDDSDDGSGSDGSH
jgi:hypothetical protein